MKKKRRRKKAKGFLDGVPDFSLFFFSFLSLFFFIQSFSIVDRRMVSFGCFGLLWSGRVWFGLVGSGLVWSCISRHRPTTTCGCPRHALGLGVSGVSKRFIRVLFFFFFLTFSPLVLLSCRDDLPPYL
jgi:hypothetical protein